MRFVLLRISCLHSTGKLNKGLQAYSLVNPGNPKTNEKIDCEVTEWKRSSCNSTCGDGYRWKSRAIIVSFYDTLGGIELVGSLFQCRFPSIRQKYPQNGGQPCPKRLTRLERCYVNCPKVLALVASHETSAESKIDCSYSEWSAWSPCSKSCGDSAVQIRTRTVLNHLDASDCSERLEKRQCEIMPCLVENGSGVYYNYH